MHSTVNALSLERSRSWSYKEYFEGSSLSQDGRQRDKNAKLSTHQAPNTLIYSTKWQCEGKRPEEKRREVPTCNSPHYRYLLYERTWKRYIILSGPSWLAGGNKRISSLATRVLSSSVVSRSKTRNVQCNRTSDLPTPHGMPEDTIPCAQDHACECHSFILIVRSIYQENSLLAV